MWIWVSTAGLDALSARRKNDRASMFRRLHKWLGRFLGFTPSTPATEESAETILARHKERFAEKIASYDRALAARAALCDVLTGQIKEIELERLRLAKALDIQATALRPDRSAAELALRWDSSGKDLADLQAQLQRARDGSHEMAAAREQVIQAARSKFAELKEGLGQDRLARALVEIGDRGNDRSGPDADRKGVPKAARLR